MVTHMSECASDQSGCSDLRHNSVVCFMTSHSHHCRTGDICCVIRSACPSFPILGELLCVVSFCFVVCDNFNCGILLGVTCSFCQSYWVVSVLMFRDCLNIIKHWNTWIYIHCSIYLCIFSQNPDSKQKPKCTCSLNGLTCDPNHAHLLMHLK